ncbi:hypothetical protein RTCIAT899_PC00220 (plasmid) [Rhizobium tropici CIAT 899]|nr:hypothetical protein RTCIAT899_PC00220 [Rhizobium tropici CIAT 899]
MGLAFPGDQQSILSVPEEFSKMSPDLDFELAKKAAKEASELSSKRPSVKRMFLELKSTGRSPLGPLKRGREP